MIPEPANRIDPHAVQVVIADRVVGHLTATDALRFREVIASIVAHGQVPRARARLWASLSFDYDYDLNSGQAARSAIGIHTDLKLALPEPHLWAPVNAFPRERGVFVPFGRSVQVSRDDEAQRFFVGLVRPEGESWLYATLHRYEQTLARSVRSLVEVRVDGTPVGGLTPRMSSEFLPLLAELGQTRCVVPALLRGNRLKADLTVHAARAGELTSDWLAEHLGHSYSHEPTSGPAADRSPHVVVPVDPAGWYPDPQGMAPLR